MAAIARCTRSAGTFSPKNTTSGFSSPPHASQAGKSNAPNAASSRSASPSGASIASRDSEVRIPSLEFQLQPLARTPSLAAQAAHRIDAAVQIDHVLTAGRLMQPIDVLSDELNDPSALLEGRERGVCVVRTRRPHAAEADKTPRPVPLARAFVPDECLEHDRRAPLPLAGGVAVIRNARVGAAAGTGEHEQPGIRSTNSANESAEAMRRGASSFDITSCV